MWKWKRKWRKTKKRKVWEIGRRRVDGQSYMWSLSCPSTGPCCCANPNNCAGEVRLLPLLPSSLPRAHPTDRMNNKPNVSLRQRNNRTWHETTTISVKFMSCSKSYFATFFSSTVTAASKSLSSPSGDWGFHILTTWALRPRTDISIDKLWSIILSSLCPRVRN